MAPIDPKDHPTIEVLVDIARAIGEKNLIKGGDCRGDVVLFCAWANEFQYLLEMDKSMYKSYHELLEDFTAEKALKAGFVIYEPEAA